MLYCGNNRTILEREPTLIMGTNSKCLRKGIGVGLNLPFDKTYLLPYDPIDVRKIYCGDQEILPVNYDRIGNLPSCLQKGVAIGKKQLVDRGFSYIREYSFITLYILIIIIIFILLYFFCPEFLKKKDDNDVLVIDELKFAMFYIILSISSYILLYILKILLKVFHLI